MTEPSSDSLLIGRLIDRFRGERGRSAEQTSLLHTHGAGTPWRLAFRDAENYVVPPELDRAAYVALLLGQPLLLTGEPGAGKSDFARKLAQLFNLGEVQEVHVKTTMLGRDLLFDFDDVARFRDTTGDNKTILPLSSYARFYGLGRAILRSAGPDYRVKPTGYGLQEIARSKLPLDAEGTISLAELFPPEFGRSEASVEKITESMRTVVLIDEIDKAQRDTPNDLLDVIERMRFPIPELGITIEASADYWPIVLVTSNAERTLPAPFLRRCVFHRLTTPEDEGTLKKILSARMTEDFGNGELAKGALKIFLALRRQSQRQPGLSELLAWCLLLQRLGFKHTEPLPSDEKNAALFEASLAALSKSDVDFEAAKRVVSQWKSGTLA